MKKKVLAALALALSSGFAAAQSSDKAGWYGGLDLGRSRLSMDGRDLDQALANQGIAGTTSIDHSDKSLGINGGYRFNRILAVEAAWERLGDFTYSTKTATDTIDGKFKADALSLAGLGIVTLTPNWSLYAKAGLARSNVNLTATSASGTTAVSSKSRARVGPLFGIGATYDFEGGIFTKVGWDHYMNVGDAPTTGKASVDLYEVGVGKRF